MRPEKLFLALSIVVFLVVLAVFFLRGGRESSGNETHVVVTPAASADDQIVAGSMNRTESVAEQDSGTAQDPASVPELDASDEVVRQLVAGLSSRPELASYLVTDGLIRRFVSAVQSVAGGYSPREELGFMKSSERFVVQRNGEQLVIAPSSFRRYRVATEVFVSCDTDGLVKLYERLEPLIEQAHRELPWKRASFENTLLEAIDHLLAAPELEGPIAVERTTLTYAFADRALEDLSDAQRLLLRLGPANARQVRAKLADLRDALFPEETPVRYDGGDLLARRAAVLSLEVEGRTIGSTSSATVQ